VASGLEASLFTIGASPVKSGGDEGDGVIVGEETEVIDGVDDSLSTGSGSSMRALDQDGRVSPMPGLEGLPNGGKELYLPGEETKGNSDVGVPARDDSRD